MDAAAARAALDHCYDGGPWNHGLDILEFRGDKAAAESVYVFEGWDARDWRSTWWAAPPRKA